MAPMARVAARADSIVKDGTTNKHFRVAMAVSGAVSGRERVAGRIESWVLHPRFLHGRSIHHRQ